MAKRRYALDEKKIAKRYKEGRGSGLSADYIPWILVHEVPSKGKSSIRNGWKTGRDHHFLSDLEARYFFTLEWNDDVTDIREQYPLPLGETQQIAMELRVKHPKDPSTKTDIPVTTDFVLTVKTLYSEKIIARAVKYSKDLKKRRNVEKLLIEKEYWRRRGVSWGIISEESVDVNLVFNVAWIHNCWDLRGFVDSFSESDYFNLCAELPSIMERMSHLPLNIITTSLDQEHHFRSGITLTIVKHLIAHRKIKVDMSKRINTDHPLVLL